jgi:succinate-semialdehyde dehydrogenase/glutarate-semialdehyde dehydrogenase
MTREQGKPLAEAFAEVDRAAEIIEWDAEEGRRHYGRVIESVPGQRRMVVRDPLGVIAGFSPWNAPVGSPAR